MPLQPTPLQRRKVRSQRINRPDNPGSRAPKFYWRFRPEGRAALTIIYAHICLRYNADSTLVYNRDWARKLHLTKEVLERVLCQYLPWFPDVWVEAGMDRETLSRNLLNRVTYMYLKRPAPGKAIGAWNVEHPAYCKRLEPYLNTAEQIVRDNISVSLEMVQTLFGPYVLPQPGGDENIDGDR